MDAGYEISESKEAEILVHEISLIKQLIKERAHPLDLLRELISNAASREVGAKNIKVRYYVHPEYGNVFEVSDDGCGMDFTGDINKPGRLDKFLGLGLSGIVGIESDEFSWKGLGSKLAFQSRKVEIKTWTGKGKVLHVVVEEPWEAIERGKKPRPKITEWEASSKDQRGTTITVYGHPPHWKDKTFNFDQIKDYLLHRAFVGYTKERENPPIIELSVFGKTERLNVGFPELKILKSEPSEGTVIIEPITVEKEHPDAKKKIKVTIKGFYTWDDKKYGLGDIHLNTGLIVSVNGIPYFSWNLRDLGSGQLGVANPGNSKCCLIVECDEIRDEMNISRTGLVDSAITDLFKETVKDLIRQIESTERHLKFRQIPKKRKEIKTAEEVKNRKEKLESKEQKWVYFRNKSGEIVRLLRVPENETDTLAILWKLEALGGLPFKQFETLGYLGKGPDLIVHFQEDERSEPERYASFEVENIFWNYKPHGHIPSLYPTVICWDLGSKPKVRIEKTEKRFKFWARLSGISVRIYALKYIDSIFIGDDESNEVE